MVLFVRTDYKLASLSGIKRWNWECPQWLILLETCCRIMTACHHDPILCCHRGLSSKLDLFPPSDTQWFYSTESWDFPLSLWACIVSMDVSLSVLPSRHSIHNNKFPSQECDTLILPCASWSTECRAFLESGLRVRSGDFGSGHLGQTCWMLCPQSSWGWRRVDTNREAVVSHFPVCLCHHEHLYQCFTPTSNNKPHPWPWSCWHLGCLCLWSLSQIISQGSPRKACYCHRWPAREPLLAFAGTAVHQRFLHYLPEKWSGPSVPGPLTTRTAESTH